MWGHLQQQVQATDPKPAVSEQGQQVKGYFITSTNVMIIGQEDHLLSHKIGGAISIHQ